jgi:hypothetical protein
VTAQSRLAKGKILFLATGLRRIAPHVGILAQFARSVWWRLGHEHIMPRSLNTSGFTRNESVIIGLIAKLEEAHRARNKSVRVRWLAPR